MNNSVSTVSKGVYIPVFLSFFVMGFVDIVGISANYVKKDFGLSESLANLIPMMSFLWFVVCAVPTGLLMKKIGRKKTVLLSLILTVVTMVIPLFCYNFIGMLVCFALLGIGNTILQVSLNPLVADIVGNRQLTGALTLGQFVKAISSFLGPILAGFSLKITGDWKLTFLIYCVVSVLATLLLVSTSIREKAPEDYKTASFGSLLGLLRDGYILRCFIIILLIVGIDVALNTSIPKVLMAKTSMPLSQAGMGTSVYFAARTVGTFVGTFLLIKFLPLKFMKYSVLSAIVAYLALIFVMQLWFVYLLIVLVGLACANVFSIVFSLAIQHDRAHADEISALMITGVLGGAVLPPLQGVCSDYIGFVPAMFLLLICLVAIELISFKLKKIDCYV